MPSSVSCSSLSSSIATSDLVLFFFLFFFPDPRPQASQLLPLSMICTIQSTLFVDHQAHHPSSTFALSDNDNDNDTKNTKKKHIQNFFFFLFDLGTSGSCPPVSTSRETSGRVAQASSKAEAVTHDQSWSLQMRHCRKTCTSGGFWNWDATARRYPSCQRAS